MNAYENMAGIGLNAGSSGEALLGTWSGRTNSPQREHAVAATKVLRDLLHAQAEDERIHNYTAEGRQEVRQRRARPALKRLGEVLDTAVATQREDLARAARELDAAVAKVAPPYSSGSSYVHVDLECARTLRADSSLRNQVIGHAEAGDLPQGYLCFAAAIVRLPNALTGVSGEQQGAVYRALGGGDLYGEALREFFDVATIVTNAARRVMIESGLSLPAVVAVHARLGNRLAGNAMEPELRPLPKDNGIYKPLADSSSEVPMQQGDAVAPSLTE